MKYSTHATPAAALNRNVDGRQVTTPRRRCYFVCSTHNEEAAGEFMISGALTRSGFEFPASEFASQLVIEDKEAQQQSIQTRAMEHLHHKQGMRLNNSLDTLPCVSIRTS